jgi:ADP-heptose:LPS heptosyltransferase
VTHRVLVTRLDGAGDVLLAGPAVRAIASGPGPSGSRTAARDTEVTLLCGPAGEAAARLLPGVAHVRVWASPWVVNPAPPIDRAALDHFVDGLAERDFAEAVILTSFHQSPLPTALLLRLAGVGRITGASIDYPGTLLDVRLRPGAGGNRSGHDASTPRSARGGCPAPDHSDDLPEDLPEPERALAIAAAAGYRLPPGDAGGLAVLPPPRVDLLLAPLHGPGGRVRPYVVLHPGAAVTARRWPAAHHRRAAALLAADGLAVVVTGGPDERALTAEVAEGARDHALDLGGRTGLAELSGVLAGAAAVVVGNTGAAHLAAAVGTPVVSLFAPVVPAVRWRPYRVRQVLLGDQTAPCRDTRARDCPVPGHPCLTGVEPEDVLDAVRRLRAGPVRGPRRPRTAHPPSSSPAQTKGNP